MNQIEVYTGFDGRVHLFTFNGDHGCSMNLSHEEVRDLIKRLTELLGEDRPEESLPPTLYLKWGSIKGGDFSTSPEASKLFEDLPDRDEDKDGYNEKACEIIDMFNGGVYFSWEGRYGSKEEAKDYIKSYLITE